MSSAMQYRAKAAEFKALLASMPRSPGETSELRNLQQTYTTLAENEEWLAVHFDKTIQRKRHDDDRTDEEWLAVHFDKTIQRKKHDDGRIDEEEQILRCLGAAVIMLWNTVPTRLQRELFDCAGTIGDFQQTAPLRGRMARFLHDHKDDHWIPAIRNKDAA